MTTEQLIYVNRLTFELITSKKLKADIKRLEKRFGVGSGIIKETTNLLVQKKYLTHNEGFLRLSDEVKKQLDLKSARNVVSSSFVPPTEEESIAYVLEKLDVSKKAAKEIANEIFSYWDAREWKWGKTNRPVKCWKLLFSRSFKWETIVKMVQSENESSENTFFTKID